MTKERLSTDDFVKALPLMEAQGSGGIAHLHPAAPGVAYAYTPLVVERTTRASRGPEELFAEPSASGLQRLTSDKDDWTLESIPDEEVPLRKRFLEIIDS